MNKLKAYINSGLLFIVDPANLAGDMSIPGNSDKIDQLNPFWNFDAFIQEKGSEDQNMPYPGGFEENLGYGILLQTNRLGGQYEIEKIEEDGRVVEIRIKFKE